MRLHRAVLVPACTGALVLLPSLPAHARPETVDVVLALRPADANALSRAARLPGKATKEERTAALDAARPRGAQRVARYLTSHGFTVTSNDGWTVSARGPADVATTLKNALTDDVSGVAGLSGAGARWRRHAVPAGHTGASLASAYDVVRPNSTGAGLGIATVQFSGWRSADLTTYASAAGVPAPSVTEVVTGTANPHDTSNGGDFEVALDQEVLLATAPQAAQRIYFGENTLADAVTLYSRIATDAEAGLVDVVSTSWGMCEAFADLDPAARSAMETQLARIVAAGATMFAATGDFGAYDCSSPDAPDNTAAVDYPAASQWVVGVSGTKLTGGPGTWAETAWSDPLNGAFKGYAGGGGESSSVARPSWQSGLGLTGTKRLVPDVAAMADPNTGFGVYAYLHGGWNLGGGTSAAAPIVAGHLAAALSSAGRTSGVGDIHDELYANPGAFRDVTSGTNLRESATTGYDRVTGLGSPRWGAFANVLFGDPVVTAPAFTRTLTVPVTVTPVEGMTVNAWTAAEGTTVACDPGGATDAPTSVTLADGADRVTHVSVGALDGNGVCHVGTATVLLDRAAPVAYGGLRFLTGADARVVAGWGGTEPSPASGVASYDVCVYAVGYGCQWSANGTTSKSATLSLTQGRTYIIRVVARDRAGNVSARRDSGRFAIPVDGRAFSPSRGWATVTSRSSWYGSHWTSATRGASATRSLTGTRYEILYVAYAYGGVFDVYVNNVRVRRVNTYSPTTAYRRSVVVATYGTRAARTVKVVVVGTRDSRSRGTNVAFDAARVTY